NIMSFAEAMAWGSQILMFLVLGVLVDPSQLLVTVPVALAITAVVMVLARPIAVVGTLGLLRGASLDRYHFSPAEQILLSWAGLKGAVPIILAIVPLSLGVPGADYIFNVIFVVVIVGTIIQGFTLSPLANRLGQAVIEPPRSPLRLELGGDAPIGSSVIDVYLEPDSRAVGISIVDLGLPEDIVIAAVLRGGELVTPRGSTVFQPGDHVYLISPHGANMGTPTEFLPRKREVEAQVPEAREPDEPGVGST